MFTVHRTCRDPLMCFLEDVAELARRGSSARHQQLMRAIRTLPYDTSPATCDFQQLLLVKTLPVYSTPEPVFPAKHSPQAESPSQRQPHPTALV
jgi:hypothetical protein